MDVDPSAKLDESHVHGNISVLLHPLMIISISEHWMREKLARDSNNVSVYGALLGKQNGLEVEVLNSFEIAIHPNMSVDADFFRAREGQCKQIYPDLDFIGWYTTGGSITEEDKLFNLQMQEINESLFIIKLDPLEKVGDHLPVRVYESVVSNDAHVIFKQIPYTLVHDAMERIGVDHIARASGAIDNSADSSQTAECMRSNFQAIQMLSKRLDLLKAYVEAIISGELPPNWSRLRDIRALLGRLPMDTASGDEIGVTRSQDSLMKQANDVCLAALLGGLTQSLHTLHSWLYVQKSVSTTAASTSASGSAMRRTAALPKSSLQDTIM